MYWVYFSIPLVVLSIIENYLADKQRILFKLSLIIYFLLAAGNFYNGIDWINYHTVFSSIDTSTPVTLFSHYEPLFIILLYIVSFLSNNYQLLVAVVAGISVISLYRSGKILSRRYGLSFNLSLFVLFIYLFLGFSLQGEQIRQCLAFFILLPSLVNIDKISLKKWILMLGVAVLFHSSALLLSPLYWVLRKKSSSFFVLGVLIVFVLFTSFLLSLPFIYSYFSFLPSFLYSKLSLYMSLKGEFRIGYFAILDFVSIVILLVVRKKDRLNINNVIWNGSFIFFLCHFSFYFFPTLQRLNYYLVPFVAIYAVNSVRFSLVNLRFSFYTLLLIYACISFYTQVFNPYYQTDWYEPKFYLLQLEVDTPNYIESLMVRKCSVIQEFNPLFCPPYVNSLINAKHINNIFKDGLQ